MTIEVTCPTCNGTGRDMALGQMIVCTDCSGVGHVPAREVRDAWGDLIGYEAVPKAERPVS